MKEKVENVIAVTDDLNVYLYVMSPAPWRVGVTLSGGHEGKTAFLHAAPKWVWGQYSAGNS